MTFLELPELIRDRTRTHFDSNDHFIRGEMQAYRDARHVVALLDERVREFCVAHRAGRVTS
ncbi:hypothetical protein [Rhodopseudomonas pseudopalustris]|uniref:Uncharacterized protein n=1 Tax=Rhodopseudomonas pseudopalustris TaxID=1513892 RepID=A0A1H8VXX5_9BRAD|nr:hypothetical protein [Rhodopseudomonas pseudopalustris]SEP20241.1 hypothetical protein SAMN05444123_11032 [Rhodopseudomonas pseudopalustris]